MSRNAPNYMDTQFRYLIPSVPLKEKFTPNDNPFLSNNRKFMRRTTSNQNFNLEIHPCEILVKNAHMQATILDFS